MVEIAYTDTGKPLHWMPVSKMMMLDILKLNNIVCKINGIVYDVDPDYNDQTELKALLLENNQNKG